MCSLKSQCKHAHPLTTLKPSSKLENCFPGGRLKTWERFCSITLPCQELREQVRVKLWQEGQHDTFLPLWCWGHTGTGFQCLGRTWSNPSTKKNKDPEEVWGKGAECPKHRRPDREADTAVHICGVLGLLQRLPTSGQATSASHPSSSDLCVSQNN